MKNIFKTLLVLNALGLFVFTTSLTGCNTVEGVGEDVGELGEGVEEAGE